MSGWIRRLLAYLKNVCLGTDFPVWATLLGVLLGGAATAVGTYLIVPKINYELERQKIRSEFIIRNLDDLNNRTRSLLSGVSNLHSAVLRSNKVDPEAVQRLNSQIVELQWKAIELGIIFDDKAGVAAVGTYQKSLDDLRDALQQLSSKQELPNSEKAAEDFSSSSFAVIRQLVALGGLKITARPPTSK
jgi:hypothetical protein